MFATVLFVKKKTTRAREAKHCTIQSAVSTASGHPVAQTDPPAIIEDHELPPPDYVAEMARGESSPRVLADYTEAINILKDEKRFTFREIADWLRERFGIEADHNAVYRAYTKGLPEQEAMQAAYEDDEDERDGEPL